MNEAVKERFLKIEFAALMIVFLGMIVVWPLYNCITN